MQAKPDAVRSALMACVDDPCRAELVLEALRPIRQITHGSAARTWDENNTVTRRRESDPQRVRESARRRGLFPRSWGRRSKRGPRLAGARRAGERHCRLVCVVVDECVALA